jgi:molybdopterin synthase catalytic subunit
VVTREDFDINEVVEGLRKDGVGAIVSFVGIVRDFAEIHKDSEGAKRVNVKELVYDCYEDMALQKMSDIKEYAMSNFNINDMSIIHRIGVLKPSEQIVIISVSAAHRKDAFSACEYTIEELKKIVPIWKKEIAEEKEYWVGAEGR